MKIAILGFGREGQSVLRYILKNRLYKKADIFILDKDPQAKITRGFKKRVGKNYLKNLSDFDIVFRSPGVPYNLPELQRARKSGVKFSSATKLFFEHLEQFDHRTSNVIGITGTKGKGTTATLIYKIIKAAGKRTFLAGNIGKPALDILPKLKLKVISHKSYVILELSSFQLQDLTVSPHVAVILRILPDHLDSHKTFREYVLAKSNICAHQKPKDIVFYNAANRHSRLIATYGRGKKIAVPTDDIAVPFGPEDLAVIGPHNFQNVVVAYRVVTALGFPRSAALRVLRKSKGLPHHLEFVRELRGVRYYDDSAAANPIAAIAALKSFEKKVILIAGGKNRNLNYAALGRAIRARAKAAILIGENKREIQKSIGKTSNIKIMDAVSLAAAVKIAHRLASSGDIVLLSPGSASFDMFRNFNERGDVFKALVRSIRK